MINIHIFLEKSIDAEGLAKQLLVDKLVAHASIDKDNVSFSMHENELREQISNVITAQTKAMLFDSIIKFIEEHYKGQIKVYSTPITQSNDVFAEIIRKQTQKV